MIVDDVLRMVLFKIPFGSCSLTFPVHLSSAQTHIGAFFWVAWEGLRDETSDGHHSAETVTDLL